MHHQILWNFSNISYFLKYVSWNPAGAIRAGSNPATYRYEGKTVKVEGKLSTLRKN